MPPAGLDMQRAMVGVEPVGAQCSIAPFQGAASARTGPCRAWPPGRRTPGGPAWGAQGRVRAVAALVNLGQR
jgi:hypothetical protein